MPRGRLKSLTGFVVGNKMDKTVVVDVSRIRNHPRYRKPIRWNSTVKAHDEVNQCNIGDKVMIVESKPISKSKRWRVSKVLEQGAELID
ncbi:MAG: 30S ribosomal protein S17 [Thermodesulfobacteriota bacterium]